MKHITATAIAVSITLSSPAFAGAKEVVQPIQQSVETIRYNQGEFLLELDGKDVAIQISPMPTEHSNLSFSVAVLNKGEKPFNVDVANFTIDGTPIPVRLLTKDEMVKKAESRAAWATALTALAGGLAAASMASQRDTYRATTFTPRGRAYTTVIDAPCSGCQVAAAATAAGTGYTIARIQGSLDETRQALGGDMFQLTTVDPGDSYGGRIYLTRFKRKPMDEMKMTVSINGEELRFGFRFAKPGTPAPVFAVQEPAPVPLSAAPAVAAIDPRPPVEVPLQP